MNICYIDCAKGCIFKNKSNEIIEHSFDFLPFRIMKIELKTDSLFTKTLLQKAKDRLKEIKFNKVNSSGAVRDDDEIQFKSYSGLIIEQLCFLILKCYNANPNVEIILDKSDSPINQVDLRIAKNIINQNNELIRIVKSVEIRSSFPFKPIEKVVANDFDILGFYTNNVKLGEIQKDFYIRFLYALEYKEELFVLNQNNTIDYSKTTTNTLKTMYFDNNLELKKDLVIYFVGGATKEMMNDDSISYNGSMKSANFNQNNNGIFRKLKIKNALDSISIMQLMLSSITLETRNAK
ncbi:TPA: hypothetical protein SB587_001542 [Campylobacter coli]|nr:hypothetical protein [Campylobacter coli]